MNIQQEHEALGELIKTFNESYKGNFSYGTEQAKKEEKYKVWKAIAEDYQAEKESLKEDLERINFSIASAREEMSRYKE